MIAHALSTIVLGAVFLAVTGWSPLGADALVALALGALVTALDRERASVSNASLLARAARFPLFVAASVRELARGTWIMFRVLTGIDRRRGTETWEMPVAERTRTGAAVSGLVTSASPGTVLVRVDWERRVMVINSIEAVDPTDAEREMQTFYANVQRGVFP